MGAAVSRLKLFPRIPIMITDAHFSGMHHPYGTLRGPVQHLQAVLILWGRSAAAENKREQPQDPNQLIISGAGAGRTDESALSPPSRIPSISIRRTLSSLGR